MMKFTQIFKCPAYYSLDMTCHAHGWKNLAPFTWDDETKTLLFAMSTGGFSIDVEVQQKENLVRATVSSYQKLENRLIKSVRVGISRTIDIETNTQPLLNIAQRVDKRLAKLILMGAGRMLKSPSIWEDAVKTLFTTNCSWTLTQKMAQKACSEIMSKPAPSGTFPFPSHEIVSNFTSKSIRESLPVGYRASYLLALARAFSKGGDLYGVDLGALGYPVAYKLVNSQLGFGNYATNHVMILSGYFNEIPVDSVVSSYVKNVYKAKNISKFIDRKYGEWGDYKWWGLKLDKMHRGLNWLGDKEIR